MQKYRIISKSSGQVLMQINCDNFEQSKKRQLFLIAHRMHPEPIIQTHVFKHGISDLDFIPETIIEKAVIVPQVETRQKFKSSNKGHK